MAQIQTNRSQNMRLLCHFGREVVFMSHPVMHFLIGPYLKASRDSD
jgi:hypothetical protein